MTTTNISTSVSVHPSGVHASLGLLPDLLCQVGSLFPSFLASFLAHRTPAPGTPGHRFTLQSPVTQDDICVRVSPSSKKLGTRTCDLASRAVRPHLNYTATITEHSHTRACTQFLQTLEKQWTGT